MTKQLFKPKAGAVDPSTYDWVGQFSKLDPAAGFQPLDAGKVYGLASAYYHLLREMSGRKQFASDDDGHWYLIDAKDRQEFEDWLEFEKEEALISYDVGRTGMMWCGIDFSECRIDGGTPDDEPVCPTPCYLCEEIYDLRQLYALGGVGTRLVCHDCYHRDTSEEE